MNRGIIQAWQYAGGDDDASELETSFATNQSVSMRMDMAELPAPTRADFGFAEVALTLILEEEAAADCLEASMEARR